MNKWTRTRTITQKYFENFVDQAADTVKSLTQIAMGSPGFAEIKHDTDFKTIDLSSETLKDPLFNQQRAQVVQNIMKERMKLLPTKEFQNLLRLCFQEDAIKLIVVGGVLGQHLKIIYTC